MSKKDEEMTTPKSSQIMGIKVQSEFEHPPKLQQELVRCASSVCGSTMMTQANVRSDSAPGAAPSVEVAEDPGVNLFPPPLPQPRICMWKYLDIHSVHRLEKAATVEEMREYGFELGERAPGKGDRRNDKL